MRERAELMRLYQSKGIASLSLMKDHYNDSALSHTTNSFEDGGPIEAIKAWQKAHPGISVPTPHPQPNLKTDSQGSTPVREYLRSGPTIGEKFQVAASQLLDLSNPLNQADFDERLLRLRQNKVNQDNLSNYVNIGNSAATLAAGEVLGAVAAKGLSKIVPATKRVGQKLGKEFSRTIKPSSIPSVEINPELQMKQVLNSTGKYNVPYSSLNKEAFNIAPEFEDYLIQTKQPYSPKAVEDFLETQSKMTRGIQASDPTQAVEYLRTIPPKGTNTNLVGQGLYTSNSPEVAERFTHGNGYIGDLKLDFDIPKNLSPIEKLKLYKEKMPYIKYGDPIYSDVLEKSNLLSRDEYIDYMKAKGYVGVESPNRSFSEYLPANQRVLFKEPEIQSISRFHDDPSEYVYPDPSYFISARDKGVPRNLLGRMVQHPEEFTLDYINVQKTNAFRNMGLDLIKSKYKEKQAQSLAAGALSGTISGIGNYGYNKIKKRNEKTIIR